MLTPTEAVETYILAKDGNRPFLLKQAFAGDVGLEMVVMTDAISFPSTAAGLSAVKDIWCVDFASKTRTSTHSACPDLATPMSPASNAIG